MAKKKKRRRKTTSSTPDTSSIDIPPPEPASASDELPDFDLNEDEPPASQAKPSAASSSSSVMADGPSTSDISSAMMGSTDKPTRSVNELIADRSLESKFEFDAPQDESLPDLAVLAKENEVGKKQARREARVAAAIQRKEQEEQESSNPLAAIPWFVDDKGEVNPLKILEAGTWGGIFLLVGWEVYINSPFFERAAPNAPFVFDFLM